MVAGITKIAKVADEAADAAKKAAELAKRRSKAAKKAAKTKAANRKAAEKAKARRSRGGKKAKKTKDKNIRAAEKAEAKAEKARKAARKKEHTGKSPVQNQPGVIAKDYRAMEGAGVDPDTGGSVNVARLVGTKGEEVSTGAGTRARGFVDEQATKGGRERARRVIKLEEKREAGTLTKKESAELKRLDKADAEAKDRQAGRSIKSRQAKSVAQKMRAAGGVDNYRRLLDDGVVSDDMTINQIQLAIQNAKVRGELAAGDKNKSKRISEALIESRDQKKFSRPRKGLGQARGHGGPEIFTPKPRRRPMKRGGLIKTGHKDFRKGGMFY